MSLIKWNPEVSFFSSFPGWMDDFFSDKGDFPLPAVKGVSIPAVNVTENKNEYKLEVAAPGFKKEDFKLEVKNGYLTISAETREEEKKEDDKCTRREFRFSSFSRSFALPENVQDTHINARYKDGILLIALPKSEVETAEISKTIAVQ
ncbi:MAG: Hsp20/alpha crystallin family protein [Lewinellaceae bacterium]|nr:Hsp20/alpha crystallin family protein [Lewinellaceae bacterium]